jgi:hypothetical protein
MKKQTKKITALRQIMLTISIAVIPPFQPEGSASSTLSLP